jgi:tetratricopeptide (TPR) repeat protein
MKKSYFIIYLIFISALLIFLGVRKYQTYQKDNVNKQSTSVLTAPTATDKLVVKYEEGLEKNPNNIKIELELAGAYIQKARETGDTSYFKKVDSLMNAVQKVEPNNAEAYATRGIVALARHHFADGLYLGQKAVSINPNKALYYGIIVDAQTELGQNDEAVNSLQTMVDKRPDYSSFSRIAYARELHGDIEGARTAIQTAVEEGASFGENIAWGYVELGKLDMRTDINKAEQQFNLAINTVPNYTPALEQLGKVAFAKGDSKTAIVDFQKALDILPLAQYAIDLGEVYAQIGNNEKASQYYSLAETAFNKAISGGVNTDMELSLFLSEHDLDAKRALELASESYKVRPSIYGADALAWAYYKNNNPEKAQEYITQALRLGQNDPGIVFHAGAITEQNKKSDEAKILYKKALSLNPQFSILYSKLAQSKIQ